MPDACGRMPANTPDRQLQRLSAHGPGRAPHPGANHCAFAGAVTCRPPADRRGVRESLSWARV